MKKSEPKMFVNFSITNEEFEEKVKIAMDEYAEKVIYKNLEETIKNIVDRRIERLLSSSSWSNDRRIKGIMFEEFVRQKTESEIAEAIEKNAKDILAKRLADVLAGK